MTDCSELVHFMLHKPIGSVSSRVDNIPPPSSEKPRETIYSLAEGAGFPSQSMGHMGRLDVDTSGLMIFTNDSKLTKACTCADYKGSADPRLVPPLPKVYVLGVAGRWTEGDAPIRRLKDPLCYHHGGGSKGEQQGEKWTRPANSVRVIGSHQLGRKDDPLPFMPHKGWITRVEITLSEGKNRQIRRLAFRSKLKVRSLHRVAFGPITLPTDLKPGECRYLTQREVRSLYQSALPLDAIPLETRLMKTIVAEFLKVENSVIDCIVSYLFTLSDTEG